MIKCRKKTSYTIIFYTFQQHIDLLNVLEFHGIYVKLVIWMSEKENFNLFNYD